MIDFNDNFNNFLKTTEKAQDKFDVVVVGGGTAGAYAAISAGKMGAKTAVFERSSMLGGTMTNGGVNFPGLFHKKGKQIIDGPCWESLLRCAKKGGAKIPEVVENPVNHWDMQVSVDIATLNNVLEEMCGESNVKIFYYSTVFSAVNCTFEGVKGVLFAVAGPDGANVYFTKKIIDATGDANLAGIMGYDRVKSDIIQPATIRNRLGGYDASKLDEELVNKMTEEAFESGELSRDNFWGWRVYGNLICYTLNTHIFGNDFSSNIGKTNLELRSRQTLNEFLDFFRKIPGLENIKIEYLAAECGVRETYRIIGKRMMTVDEYSGCVRYPDAICYGYYPVDLHQKGGIDSKYGVDEYKVPTISYASLIPTKKIGDSVEVSENLLVAGRCIGADQYTMSAIRVESPCMAEGQAAGVAAALCAKNNISVENIDYALLCTKLKEIGAIVPD